MGRYWRTLLVLVVTATLLNLAAVAWIVSRPEIPDPLGDFPVQRVLAVSAVDVTIEGTKCADMPVRISGNSSWQSITQPGLNAPGGSGVRDHPGGCETRVFINPLPPEVLANPGVWHIVGENCPIDDTGKVIGLCRTWETENFTVKS